MSTLFKLSSREVSRGAAARPYWRRQSWSPCIKSARDYPLGRCPTLRKIDNHRPLPKSSLRDLRFQRQIFLASLLRHFRPWYPIGAGFPGLSPWSQIGSWLTAIGSMNTLAKALVPPKVDRRKPIDRDLLPQYTLPYLSFS